MVSFGCAEEMWKLMQCCKVIACSSRKVFIAVSITFPMPMMPECCNYIEEFWGPNANTIS